MSSNYDSKKEFAKNLDKELNESLSFLEVYSRYTCSDGGRKNQRCVMCPSSDALHIYEDNCRCYSCNRTIKNVVNLYMHIHGNSNYYSSLYNLARDFGVLSEEDFNICMDYDKQFSHIKKPSIDYKVLKTKKEEKDKEKVDTADLKSYLFIDKINRLLQELCPVTPEEEQHLLNYRKVPQDKINQHYFSMPKCDDNFYKKLFSEIDRRFGYKPEDLIGVPGFYLDNKGNVRLKEVKGIGFLMVDGDGLAKAIHVRAYDSISKTGKLNFNPYFYSKKKNKTEKRSKYFWFASKDFSKGCSCGSPIDTNIPQTKRFNTCIVTEGKLKGEVILNTFNTPVISVQGVANWVGKIAPEVKLIEKKYGKLKRIFCAYDADLCFNPKIFSECDGLVKNELADFDGEIKIAVWDYKFGKGLDDVILNGHKDKLLSVNFYLFKETYEKYMEHIRELYPKTSISKIYDENGSEVDEEIIYNIYKNMVLKPLSVYTA